MSFKTANKDWTMAHNLLVSLDSQIQTAHEQGKGVNLLLSYRAVAVEKEVQAWKVLNACKK